MKLTFLGANRQVTGSCYVLEAAGLRIMVDHGLFQERDFLARNWEPCAVSPKSIDYFLLTHAHVDHIGRLPRLVAEGLNCPIHTTEPNVDLAEIILMDAARLQQEDAAYKKRRHEREGRRSPHPTVPLFDEDHARRTLPLLQGVRYGRRISLQDRVHVTFHDAGHILGSAMIEVEAEGRRIIFSGDIGQHGKPFIGDPTALQRADWVVMESTYGNRDHIETASDIETTLESEIHKTLGRGGKLIIPTFAMERAQELIYYLGKLRRDGRIGDFPVYLDSPMAVDITGVFMKYRDWFDSETQQMLRDGHAPLKFPGMVYSRSVEQSRAINSETKPSIIMAPSGMCTGGRIKHHLRLNIGNSRNTILFVGYQGRGTLGRQIRDGAREVRIHGMNWPVAAHIERIEGLSAHADRTGLLAWLGGFDPGVRRVFLTHGEEEAGAALARAIHETHGLDAVVPEYGQSFELNP